MIRILTAFAALVAAGTATAAELDCSQVRIIVPYSAGGATDVVTRLAADGLSRRLDMNVIVEPRPGAGGNLGTREVANAEPDGCTLLVNGNQMATMTVSYANLGYDPFEDLVAIGNVGLSPTFIVSSVPELNSLEDLIEMAKKEPVGYGTPGLGLLQHLAMEEIAHRTGAKLNHIPYSGGSQALADLTTGRLQVGSFAAGSALPPVRDGRLKLLAAAQEKRSSFAPDVPSAAEQGVENLNAGIYFMLFAPGGTPDETVSFISEALAEVVADPALAERYQEIGFEPIVTTPEESAAIMKRTAEQWNPVIERLGIKFD